MGKLHTLRLWSHFLEACPHISGHQAPRFSFMKDPIPTVHTEATGQLLAQAVLARQGGCAWGAFQGSVAISQSPLILDVTALARVSHCPV